MVIKCNKWCLIKTISNSKERGGAEDTAPIIYNSTYNFLYRVKE